MTKITQLTNSKLSHGKQGVAPRFWHHTSLLNVALSGLFLLFGLTYLGLVNSTAADTFAVAELSRRIDSTTTQNQHIELDIAEVLALPHVHDASQKYQLVAAASVHYINDSASVAFAE